VGTSVVSGCDAAAVLEFSEHVFDFVALPVEGFVIVEGLLSVFPAWDAGRDAPFGQLVAEPRAVIASICDQRGRLWQGWQQSAGPFVVADLAGGEMEQNRLSGLVANGVQFGVQAAFCTPQTAGKAPF
jgi:hypothetical protein